MLLLALGGQRAAGRIRALNLQRPAVRLALGGVLAASALLIAFNVDKSLQTRIGDYTPFLQKAERSCYTRKQLGQRCLVSQPASSSALKNFGPAPPFTGISTWINSKPLTTASLRGRVVLVDFWTYSCINCLRTLPHLKAWDAAYRKAGLTIVGVHTPEFAFEHVPSNVRRATRELGVRYPVAVDDDYKTWDAYQNGAWPTEYLIDRKGDIREIKEGEGDYGGTERTIRKLLGEPATAQLASVKDTTPEHPTTPESYLGWERLQRYAGSELVPDRIVPYKFPRTVPLNTLAYDGLWRVERQRIVAVDRSRLRLHFLAQAVYLVLGGHGKIKVLVNGSPVPHGSCRRAEQALHAAALPQGARGRARAPVHPGRHGLRVHLRLARAPKQVTVCYLTNLVLERARAGWCRSRRYCSRAASSPSSSSRSRRKRVSSAASASPDGRSVLSSIESERRSSSSTYEAVSSSEATASLTCSSYD